MKYDLLDVLAFGLVGILIAYLVVIQQNSYRMENIELHKIVRDQRAFIDTYMGCTPKERNSRAIMVYSDSGKKSCEIHHGTKYMVY